MVPSSFVKCVFVMSSFLLFAAQNLYGQYGNVWAWGRNGGIDFNSGKPVAVRSAMDQWAEANASISDENGELLFYTEGNRVWDRTHKLMPHGTNILPIGACGSYRATFSSSQGALIVPLPGSDSLYYLFSLTARECETNGGKLFFSIVNRSLNKGLGDVVDTQMGILLDSGLTEKMTAIPGNSCNIWIVVQAISGEIKAFEVDQNGIGYRPVLSSDMHYPSTDIAAGALVGSTDRKLLISANAPFNDTTGRGLYLYDFNARTGSAVHREVLLGGKNIYTAAFSPDDSKLYILIQDHDTGGIYQFDLTYNEIDSIKRSCILVLPTPVAYVSQLKLGPDGKIYFGSPDRTDDPSRYNLLGSINFPNLKGLACGPSKASVTLLPGSAIGIGFPNAAAVATTYTDTLEAIFHDSATCFARNYTLKAPFGAKGVLWDNGTQGMERAVSESGTYWLQYYLPGAKCTLRRDCFKIYFPGKLPDIALREACKGQASGSAWLSTPDFLRGKTNIVWRDREGAILSTRDTLNDIATGTYYLQVYTDQCDTLIPFSIPEENSFLAFELDTISCVGKDIHLVNKSTGPFHNFEWNWGNGDIDYQREPAYAYSQAGNFSITLSGSTPLCHYQTLRSIAVDSPVAVAMDFKPRSICQGEPVYFVPLAPGAEHLVWQLGTQTFGGNNRSFVHAFDLQGAIEVRLTAHFRACPEMSAFDTVLVTGLPLVDLGNDTILCHNAAPIILSNRAGYSQGAYRYRWNTKDTTAWIAIFHPGNYQLTLTDKAGCSNTADIIVGKGCYIDIPNVFTPNGDGSNDYFFPRVGDNNLTHFQMKIWDRWGNTVFQTSTINGAGWDGRYNGRIQSSGVYIYRIELGRDDGRKDIYRGNITLLK